MGTVKALTMIFNTSYKTGKIPQEWGRSVIWPIYKNKGDFPKCENYRGISLLSHAFRIYESVLGDSIMTDVTISETYSLAADKFINTDP